MVMDCEKWAGSLSGLLKKWWPTIWKVLRFILCIWVTVEVFLLVMAGD